MADYSSVSEVVPYCRMLLDGESTFNAFTIPTETEVASILARLSGVLNLALQRVGLAVPVTVTDAKLACDDWVTRYTVMNVRSMAPGLGYSDQNEDSMYSYKALMKSARDFAQENRLGFIQLGVTQDRKMSDGLAFTGMDAQDERTDPDDSTMEQPLFERNQWNNKTLSDEDVT